MATKLAPLAAAAGNIPFLAKAKPHAIVIAILSNGTKPTRGIMQEISCGQALEKDDH